jgi:hypothetical protein
VPIFWIAWILCAIFGKDLYNTIIAFIAGAVAIAFLRGDLIPLMLTSVVSFTALYFFPFLCLLFLDPDFVRRFYNIPNLLGIYVLEGPSKNCSSRQVDAPVGVSLTRARLQLSPELSL